MLGKVMRIALVARLRRTIRKLDRREEHLPPTASELQKSVAHIAYEMAAMERAADLASEGGRVRFEAFLLHARLMREFLWGRSDRGGPGAENSLFAEHYVPDVRAWRSSRGSLPPILKATKDRIDRQLVHLSRDREGAFSDLEFRMPDIQEEITTQWTRFEGALSSSWASTFQQSLAEKRSEMAGNNY